MPPKLKFTEGEKVLCFHGPLLYEAKALKSMVTKDKHVKYFIHYAGWNKNWDEWVPEDRVLKYNEANVQRQKEVSKLHANMASKNKKTGAKNKKADGQNSSSSKDSDSRASTPSKEITKESTPAGSQSSLRGRSSKPPTASTSATTSSAVKVDESKDDSSKNKKRARLDQTVESEEQFLSKIEVKIKIPDELKPILVDDWDCITRQNKLVDLPAKVSVQEIMDNYVQSKKANNNKNKTGSKDTSSASDLTNGLIEYFNAMVGSQLLYKFERPQYAELLQDHPDTKMSNIYGSTHLLRLFVRLGSMLSFTTLDEKSVQIIVSQIQDFLKYLVKNSTTLFPITNFVNVTPEYHRKAL